MGGAKVSPSGLLLVLRNANYTVNHSMLSVFVALRAQLPSLKTAIKPRFLQRDLVSFT